MWTLILIIVVLILIYREFSTKENFLQGMWKCDPDFCEKAGVDGVLLYIGDRDNGYISYIIMTQNNEIIANEKFRLSPNVLYTKTAVVFEDGSSLCDQIPARVNLTLDISKGKMTWYDSNNQYFVFYKSHIDTKVSDDLNI